MVRPPSSFYALIVKPLIALAMSLLVGCHRSGSPTIEGGPVVDASVSASRDAPSIDKTAADSAASVSLFIAGTPRENWNYINEAVQDTLFRFLGSNSTEGWIRARSVARGLILNVAILPNGGDSTRVVISGQRYTGNSERPGVTLLGADSWPEIVTGEPAVARLEGEAIRIREGIDRSRLKRTARRSESVARGESQPMPFIAETVSPDSLVRVLADGKLGYCRANTVRRDHHLDSLLIVDVQNRPEWCPLPPYLSLNDGNTFILVDPRTIAVGDTISACARFGSPRRYVLISEALYSNPSRCPDGSDRKPLEPNMKILRREK